MFFFYLAKELGVELAGLERFFGNGVSFVTVLIEDLLKVRHGGRLNGRDPVGERNGVMHGNESTDTTSRIHLL